MPHSAVEQVGISELKLFSRTARTHSKKQIAAIARSIEHFGFTNPVLVDDEGGIIAGHGRVEAARQLGLTAVPTLRLSHLTAAQKRAYVLADNKLADRAGWDREILALELGELSVLLGDDLELTGFETAEIDLLLADLGDPADPLDEVPQPLAGPPITRSDDLWQLGRHRLLCGDSRDETVFARLLAGELAEMIFADVPYNVPIAGHVLGRNTRHREFAMAAGEMSPAEFIAFLTQVLGHGVRHAKSGAIHYICVDWRSVSKLVAAGETVGAELKNICVWVKPNAGQGTFYRSRHEFVAVFKSGDAPHINTFELGQHGRSRSNVWEYAGANSFRVGRLDDLALHPTVKPVALVVDAMKDCSNRNGLVLDPFMGSGTTIMAAEKVGRRAFGIEYEPGYVDGAIRRWQAFTRRDAVLEATGQTFAEVEAERRGAIETAARSASDPAPPITDDGREVEDESWVRLTQPAAKRS